MKINIKPKIKNTVFQISALLILLAAIANYFDCDLAKYTMIVGALGYAFSVFISSYPGKSVRGKRLYNMQIFSALFMVISAYLMFTDMTQWPVTLLIGVILLLYSTLMMDRTYRKEKEENSES